MGVIIDQNQQGHAFWRDFFKDFEAFLKAAEFLGSHLYNYQEDFAPCRAASRAGAKERE